MRRSGHEGGASAIRVCADSGLRVRHGTRSLIQGPAPLNWRGAFKALVPEPGIPAEPLHGEGRVSRRHPRRSAGRAVRTTGADEPDMKSAADPSH